jgi:hypothetical protein
LSSSACCLIVRGFTVPSGNARISLLSH